MEVGGKLNAAARMPPGKNPGTNSVGAWVAPRAGLNVSEESSLRLSGFEHQNLRSTFSIRWFVINLL
jgi:hypothetical protein